MSLFHEYFTALNGFAFLMDQLENHKSVLERYERKLMFFYIFSK